MRVAVAIVAGLFWSASPAWAQTPRAITLDDLYDPDTRIDFSGGAPTGLTWISDTHVDALLVKHMRQTMFVFTLETLLTARPATATNDGAPGRR